MSHIANINKCIETLYSTNKSEPVRFSPDFKVFLHVASTFPPSPHSLFPPHTSLISPISLTSSLFRSTMSAISWLILCGSHTHIHIHTQAYCDILRRCIYTTQTYISPFPVIHSHNSGDLLRYHINHITVVFKRQEKWFSSGKDPFKEVLKRSILQTRAKRL